MGGERPLPPDVSRALDGWSRPIVAKAPRVVARVRVFGEMPNE